MKPVYQTRSSIGDGNCLPACIASILELNIEDVDFVEEFSKIWETEKNPESKYWEMLDERLKSLGWGLFQSPYHFFKKKTAKGQKDSPYKGALTECYCILSFPLKQKNQYHAVVGYIDKDWNVKVVHDPDKNSSVNRYPKEYYWNVNECKLIEFLVKR